MLNCRDSAAGCEEAPTWLEPSQALQRFAPAEPIRLQRTGAGDERQRYGFRIGTLSLLVPLGIGSEVLAWSPPAALPNSPGWLLGVINLRGALVPVFDLAPMFDGDADHATTAPDGPDARRMILVLDKGDRAAGLVIDGHPRPLRGMRATPQLPALPATLQAYVSAAWADDADVWLDFGHESLLLELAKTTGGTVD